MDDNQRDLLLIEISGSVKSLTQAICGNGTKGLNDRVTDLENLPHVCITGIRHEERIHNLEIKPEKKLSVLSVKSGIITSVAAVLISVVAIVFSIIFK